MGWRIRITFPAAVGDEGNDFLHRVRNFGETLYGHFNDHGGGVVDLKHVDNATNALVVEHVSKRDLGGTLQTIRKLVAKHFPDRMPEIIKDKEAG